MVNKIKNKKIFVIAISIVSILIIVGVVLFVKYTNNRKKLETGLEKITTDYYNNDFVELMPNLLKRNGSLTITLRTLKELEKDVSFFEKSKCDLENTYVVLTYNEKTNYDIETHLDCK